MPSGKPLGDPADDLILQRVLRLLQGEEGQRGLSVEDISKAIGLEKDLTTYALNYLVNTKQIMAIQGVREVVYFRMPPGLAEHARGIEESRTQRAAEVFAKQAAEVFVSSLEPGAEETVNHPKHYNMGKFEVIDVIEDWQLGFCEGNAIKYIARAKHKGNELEDLRKAAWYLQHAIKKLEET